MKINPFLLYAFLLLGFAACSTDDDPVVEDSDEDEVSSADVTAANEAISEYDAEGNLYANLSIGGTITLTWSGSTVSAEGSADGVEMQVSGGDVTVQSTTDAVINYVLNGTSSDGSFKLYSETKSVVTLDNLTLTSQNAAAINCQSKKSLYVYLPSGSSSTLADASTYVAVPDSEDCKACLFSEGQIILCGTGTLQVTGNTQHAVASDDYLVVNDDPTLRVTSAVKDAVHVNDYVVIESGTLSLSGSGKDGIDTDGAIAVSGGVVTVQVTGASGKGIKSVGDFTMSGGTLTLTTSGAAEWESGSGTSVEYANAACLKTSGSMSLSGGTIQATSTGTAGRGVVVGGDFDLSGGTCTVQTSGAGYQYSSSCDYTAATGVKVGGNMTVTGGTLTTTVTGSGSKALKVAGKLVQSDGSVSAYASGSNLGSSGSSNGGMGGGFWGYSSSSSSYSSSAKGVKVTGAIKVTGGKLYATSSKHEAIESKSTLDVTGGEVYGYSASDDGINASSHMTISGGFVCGYALNNDGLDANGNVYIKGGVIFAVGAGSPEVAIDANTESGYKLYVQGGTLMTVGPLESGASLSQTCYRASSWSKGTKYAVTVGDDTYVLTTPSSSAGSGMVFSGASAPSVLSGVSVSGGTSYFEGVGSVVANGKVSGGSEVSLSTYSSSSRF